MLADPQSATFTLGAKTLVRINQDQYSSEYYLRESDVEYFLRIRHQKVAPSAKYPLGLDRHNVEFKEVTFATSTVPEFTRKCYGVMEAPASKINNAMWSCLVNWLQAGTPSNSSSVNQWQS